MFLVAVIGCSTPGIRWPDSMPAEEMARAKLLTHVVASVKPVPTREGMRDGAVAVVMSATGERTVVMIARFDPTIGDFDAAFEGFRDAQRKRVKETRQAVLHLKPFSTTVELGDNPDPALREAPVLLWVRTHRDVALLVMAPSEREGALVITEYAVAWDRV